MPIYEFRCNDCHVRVAIFFKTMTVNATGTCERCGSEDLVRVFSSFRVLRTPFDAGSFNKKELLDGVNYTDPQSMANMFKRMQETFQDGPDEHMDEMVKRLEYGEPVEKAMDLNMGSNYKGDPHGHHHDHGHSHGGDD